MDFSDGETVLFRHQGIHNKRKGDVLITTLRVIFTPSEAVQDSRTLVWANIDKVEYSPQNNPITAMKITTVQGSDQVMIQLIGGKNEERLGEFQRMRNIITATKKGFSSFPTVASANSGDEAKNNPVSSSSSRNFQTVNSTERLKQHLIKTDKAIGKLYKELVEGKIITAEDFWKTHHEALLAEESKQTSTNKQGLANALWADIIREQPDGKKNIVLTPEKKEIIFHLFPHVRIAFEREVPVNYNEKEFWKKFLDAEYHKGTGHTVRRHDPLFGKYISEAKDVVSNLLEQAKKRQRFDDGTIVTPEIDLTANYGDSKRKEGFDGEDRVGMVEQNVDDRNHLINIKAFQESVALVKTESESKGSRMKMVNGNDRTECEELKRTKLPTYVPVDMQLLTQHQTNNSKETIIDNFVVKSGYKRKFDGKSLIEAFESGYLSQKNVKQLPVAELEGRANKLFSDEIERLQDLDATTSLGLNNMRNDELPQAINTVCGLLLIDYFCVLKEMF